LQRLNVLVAAQGCTAIDLLCEGISSDASLRLAGPCLNARDALAAAARERPTVIMLDLRLCPDGDYMLIGKLHKSCGAQVVAMDAAAGTSLCALDAGAEDFELIPTGGSESDDRIFAADALARIKAAALARKTTLPFAGRKTAPIHLLAVACAKGGPVAAACLLNKLPKDGPAVLILQQNAGAFTGEYALTLAGMCGRKITAGLDGMELASGCVYWISDDGYSEVRKAKEKILLSIKKAQSARAGNPADTLFISMAKALGRQAACVLLSGSGGQNGLERTAARGGLAILQNKNALLREIGYEAPGGIIELALEDIAGEIGKRM
jgi:two-component system, chemotaxis family, protein-glutamate methylesterase/glutaminase